MMHAPPELAHDSDAESDPDAPGTSSIRAAPAAKLARPNTGTDQKPLPPVGHTRIGKFDLFNMQQVHAHLSAHVPTAVAGWRPPRESSDYHAAFGDILVQHENELEAAHQKLRAQYAEQRADLDQRLENLVSAHANYKKLQVHARLIRLTLSSTEGNLSRSCSFSTRSALKKKK